MLVKGNSTLAITRAVNKLLDVGSRVRMQHKTTTRSIEFIAQFQIEALCQSLRTLILARVEPGPQSRQTLKSLRDELVARTTGRPSERIPKVTDDTSASDLLVIAELVRATGIAFLSPEDIEQRNSIGLHASGTES